jgi:hypothetical protein
MARVSSGTRIASGRAGDVSFAAPGLMEFLREMSQALDGFNDAMRIAAQAVAQKVVDDAKKNAAAQPPHGKPNPRSSGRSQAQVVVNGLRARRDRLPTIKLDRAKLYPSRSRSNRIRGQNRQIGPGLASAGIKGFTRKVFMSDVFFGAEFGGRARNTTKQFLRHRGRQGYFFWQAVRDNKSYIVKEYSDAIDRVLKELAAGAK